MTFYFISKSKIATSSNFQPHNIKNIHQATLGVSKVQFCATNRPQFFEFEVVSCRTCSLMSKYAFLEVATSKLQK